MLNGKKNFGGDFSVECPNIIWFLDGEIYSDFGSGLSGVNFPAKNEIQRVFCILPDDKKSMKYQLFRRCLEHWFYTG